MYQVHAGEDGAPSGRRREMSKKIPYRQSSMASLNTARLLSPNQNDFKQCRTHGAFHKNFAGYMKFQTGFFGMWKVCFFTLQGIELTIAEDEGLPAARCDTIAYVSASRGKPTLLQFHMKSKKVWKTQCISTDIANAWFSAVEDCMSRLSYSLDRYLRSCEKRQTPTVLCGWLSQLDAKGKVMGRYFYVLRHLTVSMAPNVDVLPEVYDVVTDATAAGADGAMELRFQTQPSMVLRFDSVELLRVWHAVLHTCMKEPSRALFG
ncbi:hypothetical protein AaE_010673 [Aphanomyces astaci]|uniref:PH domain-containing protein n=1 Tax=Aphanomyces astaci TaxID=112090 RepID=A0A6A4ZWK8_APHAT|nr:hypothetical protein AaE_010673 [Aphanomyces astaci]